MITAKPYWIDYLVNYGNSAPLSYHTAEERYLLRHPAKPHEIPPYGGMMLWRAG